SVPPGTPMQEPIVIPVLPSPAPMPNTIPAPFVGRSPPPIVVVPPPALPMPPTAPAPFIGRSPPAIRVVPGQYSRPSPARGPRVSRSAMKFVIPGGRGPVGRVLCRALGAAGHEVVVLSRAAAPPEAGARVVAWDGRTVGGWAGELDGADVVVNLAGRSV